MNESDSAVRGGLTRRQVLLGAGGAGALALAGVGVAQVVGEPRRLPRIASFAVDPAGRVAEIHSRPDLRPPTVITTAGAATEVADRADPDFLFIAPGPVTLSGTNQYGPLIVDRRGELVWFRPVGGTLQATNFACSRYRGEPVLLWWEGKVYESGYGRGEVVLLDRAYREVARVRAARGQKVDMHALTLTPQGTVVFTCHPETVPADLSSIGGPRRTQLFESIIQEVDVATGRLLFEWRSLDHIPPSDSYQQMQEPYDYLHVNSVRVLPDGNLLISARHTWAVYKLDRRTGDVIWKLGGKHSDFQVGAGAEFAWQHDARQVSDRALTVFDNGTDGPVRTERQSRGLVLDVDYSRRTVALRRAYTSPQRLSAGAMGSVQILPSGHVVVGWGVASHTSEFDPDGALLFDVALPPSWYSYTGLWLPWSGAPHRRPTVVSMRQRHGGRALMYASWNGATEVTGWLVHAGARRGRLRPVGIAPRRGFETEIPLHHELRYASVTALGRHGKQLRRSPVVEL